jgi:hypothetical protein
MIKKITASLTLALLPLCAFSEVFQTTITVDGKGETQTQSFGFDAGQDLFNKGSIWILGSF